MFLLKIINSTTIKKTILLIFFKILALNLTNINSQKSLKNYDCDLQKLSVDECYQKCRIDYNGSKNYFNKLDSKCYKVTKCSEKEQYDFNVNKCIIPLNEYINNLPPFIKNNISSINQNSNTLINEEGKIFVPIINCLNGFSPDKSTICLCYPGYTDSLKINTSKNNTLIIYKCDRLLENFSNNTKINSTNYSNQTINKDYQYKNSSNENVFIPDFLVKNSSLSANGLIDGNLTKNINNSSLTGMNNNFLDDSNNLADVQFPPILIMIICIVSCGFLCCLSCVIYFCCRNNNKNNREIKDFVYSTKNNFNGNFPINEYNKCENINIHKTNKNLAIDDIENIIKPPKNQIYNFFEQDLKYSRNHQRNYQIEQNENLNNLENTNYLKKDTFNQSFTKNIINDQNLPDYNNYNRNLNFYVNKNNNYEKENFYTPEVSYRENITNRTNHTRNHSNLSNSFVTSDRLMIRENPEKNKRTKAINTKKLSFDDNLGKNNNLFENNHQNLYDVKYKPSTLIFRKNRNNKSVDITNRNDSFFSKEDQNSEIYVDDYYLNDMENHLQNNYFLTTERYPENETLYCRKNLDDKYFISTNKKFPISKKQKLSNGIKNENNFHDFNNHLKKIKNSEFNENFNTYSDIIKNNRYKDDILNNLKNESNRNNSHIPKNYCEVSYNNAEVPEYCLNTDYIKNKREKFFNNDYNNSKRKNNSGFYSENRVSRNNRNYSTENKRIYDNIDNLKNQSFNYPRRKNLMLEKNENVILDNCNKIINYKKNIQINNENFPFNNFKNRNLIPNFSKKSQNEILKKY